MVHYSSAGTLLTRFIPQPLAMSQAERVRGSAGALLGIGLTGLISTWWVGASVALPLLIAPMGASAVLLFGVPASPLAQPWSIVGGNVVSAIVGVTAARVIGAPVPAAAVAVGLAFAAMSLLRCLHPPGGAVALSAVVGGPHVLALGYGFVAVPVALNSLVLVAVALAYNNAVGRSYPHHAHPPAHPHPPMADVVLDPADLDAVLADYGEAVDIGRDDLAALFHELLGRAQARARADGVRPRR